MTLHESYWWFLLLAALLPLIWWRWIRRDRYSSMKFSSTETVQQLGGTWVTRARHILPALRTCTVILLVLILVRPQKGNQQTRIFSEGIAVQLLIDRSGSMEAMDFRVDGKPVDRLAAVKNVVEDFVLGDEHLPGRPDDLIGMIAYGTHADSTCPLTLDHEYLIHALKQTEIAKTQAEGQTAIGDAIALGVERLRALENQRRIRQAHKIKSKIMILLTDGESNAGDIEPVKAAELAATYDIKIYTIGAGTKGMAPVPAVDVFGRKYYRKMPVSIDEETLKKIADTTDGQYYRATDTDSLKKVYAEIDKLEKTKTEEKRYMQYKELATESVALGSLRMPPLFLAVFILLALEVVLANTRFRRIP